MGRTRPASQELNELCQRVAEWRAQHGGRRSRIPREFWDEAVRVARVDGVYGTSKALCFRYDRLKERFEQSYGSESAENENDARADLAGVSTAEPVKLAQENKLPVTRRTGRTVTRERAEGVRPNGALRAEGNGSRFVALDMSALGGGLRSVIELVGRRGDRMRIDVPGGVDLGNLVEGFWSREP